VNLTIPHKEAAVSLLDRLSPVAERIGAVNTVVVEPDGTLSGDNTDGFGFVAALSESRVGWQAVAGPAVVLGAGGAARAVAVALLDAGAPEVRLLNRTPDRARALAGELGGSSYAVDWAERSAALDGAALLVNTTSLGMRGQPPLVLPLEALPRTALVTDVVYTPLITPLLALAQARGNPVVDGLGMLLHQARPGFRAWFGVDPAVDDDLRTVVAAGLSPAG
jgi:shikimate dehydrogenase